MRSSSPTPVDLVTRCQPLLGTLVEISVPAQAAKSIDAAFAAVRHVHQCMSFQEPGSDLARLRAAPAGSIVTVDPETVVVLRLASALYGQTFGLFDVTIGRELVRSGFLPRVGIADLRDFPGRSTDIEIVDDCNVRCRRRALIDLGGIAKGYAVDRAVEALIARGAVEGLVNAGGDLRAFGTRHWPVHLRDGNGGVTRSLMLVNRAIASSSNLLNRRRRGGQRWSPHLDRDRRPVLIDGTISVVAERCVLADAMTKVAMTAPDLAREILAPHGGYVLATCELAGAA
jgi:FAD:protein FMN transferase